MTDKDLRDFARSFAKGILGAKPDDLMCFAVSAPLAGYLNFLGVQCELVEGEVGGSQHYWIEFPDKRIIDVTAKQFGRKNIFLKPRPREYVCLS